MNDVQKTRGLKDLHISLNSKGEKKNHYAQASSCLNSILFPCEMWQSQSLSKEFLVSKETVVLRRWERSKQQFGFIKRVDKGWITTVKDLESWRFER